jgi:diacylglycerol O-acyltransferase
MTVSLATNIADRADRMETIYGNSQGAREMAKALTAQLIMDLTETTPPVLPALAAKPYTASRIGGHALRSTWLSPTLPAPPSRFIWLM